MNVTLLECVSKEEAALAVQKAVTNHLVDYTIIATVFGMFLGAGIVYILYRNERKN